MPKTTATTKKSRKNTHKNKTQRILVQKIQDSERKKDSDDEQEREYEQEQSEQAKEELLKLLSPYIKHAASRIDRPTLRRLNLSRSDLEAEANMAALSCALHFRRSAASFLTYARGRISGAIHDLIRAENRQTGNTRGTTDARAQLTKTTEAFAQIHLRAPSQHDEERLIEENGISNESLEGYTQLESFERPNEFGTDDDPKSHQDTLAHKPSRGSVKRYNVSRLFNMARAAYQTGENAERDFKIFQLYYTREEQPRLQDIGKTFGVGESRASQVLTKGTKAVRKAVQEQGLTRDSFKVAHEPTH